VSDKSVSDNSVSDKSLERRGVQEEAEDPLDQRQEPGQAVRYQLGPAKCIVRYAVNHRVHDNGIVQRE
jgi:hypothetical protein